MTKVYYACKISSYKQKSSVSDLRNCKIPFRKPIVNPAFAKRSVDIIGDTKALSKKKMHDMQKNANYLLSLHEKSIEFHRSGRKSLYVKVEKVLQA